MVLIAGYVVFVMVKAAAIGNLHTGDTDLLVTGARLSLHCVDRGTLIGCGHAAGSPLSQVGPYAFLQYLPAMALVHFGLTDNQAIHALGSINLAAFAASLVVAAIVARRMRPGIWAPILVLALVGSSLTYQSTSGFGEMFAAFFALLAVAAVIWRRPILILFAMTLATTGKETLFPFLLALGLLAGRREEDGLLPPLRITVALVGAVAVGEFLNVGFDVFRFGVDKNLTYLEPIGFTPGLERKANFLAAVWVAPSNGALWYWPLAVLLVVAVAVFALIRLVRAPKKVGVWLPPLLAVATLGAFTAGLADWYTPFGWITYGPRLLVPLFPAALVVILYTGGPLLAGPLRRLLSAMPGASVGAVVVVAAGWAQFGAPWSWMPTVLGLQTASGGCPVLTKVIIQNGINRYYHCSQIVMWRIHPSLIKIAATQGGGDADVARLILSVAERAARRRPGGTDSPVAPRRSMAAPRSAPVKAGVTSRPRAGWTPWTGCGHAWAN